VILKEKKPINSKYDVDKIPKQQTLFLYAFTYTVAIFHPGKTIRNSAPLSYAHETD